MEREFYILDEENRPVRATMLEWGRFFEDIGRRTVNWTQARGGKNPIEVSTVFLGIDHRHFGKGPPLLFETMIFGGELDGSCWRYASWDDAEAGHKAAVRKARQSMKARTA